MPDQYTKQAKEIVNAIIKDICDRSGIGDEWDSIDKGTQNSIISEWKDLIIRILSKSEVKESRQLQKLDKPNDDSIQIHIKGKCFHCECGCNLFHHEYVDDNIYTCNACHREYTGS